MSILLDLAYKNYYFNFANIILSTKPEHGDKFYEYHVDF